MCIDVTPWSLPVGRACHLDVRVAGRARHASPVPRRALRLAGNVCRASENLRKRARADIRLSARGQHLLRRLGRCQRRDRKLLNGKGTG